MSNAALIQRIRRTPQAPAPILACSKLALCIMPIAQIAIGAVYLDDCPRQPYIPIYLIVVGVFGIILAVLSCLPCAQEPEDGTSNPLSRLCTIWNSLTTFFLFCWFIAGNVWIYSIYKPNYDKSKTSEDPYCNKILYLFAFWTTTSVYILLCLFLFCGCCALVCFYIFRRADPDDDI
ncbi:transmembrane protein 272-like [Scomber scombrus]|uniref:Transmembrane protein 272-like n=1 Tax=Scomber scombrus TaxID=13677 RepID=A0AAV1N0N9_SCOSC|nr:transmembrane protein 272-like [Scomber scombrus]XP_062300922.1 transmembrane protein 272-like [Scomber scombrus]